MLPVPPAASRTPAARVLADAMLLFHRLFFLFIFLFFLLAMLFSHRLFCLYSYFSFLSWFVWLSGPATSAYLNLPQVREAFHVKPESFYGRPWSGEPGPMMQYDHCTLSSDLPVERLTTAFSFQRRHWGFVRPVPVVVEEVPRPSILWGRRPLRTSSKKKSNKQEDRAQ